MDISIAIPSSSLMETQTSKEKSLKVSFLARSISIFRVKTVYIYNDSTYNKTSTDSTLIKTLLEFLNTPPYLRKIIYPKSDILKYVGLLPPINSPHHPPKESISKLKIEDIRMGVIIKDKDKAFVEIGLDTPIPISTKRKSGEKINVKIVSIKPKIEVREIQSSQIKGYWGYDVKIIKEFRSIVNSIGKQTILLITSRHGYDFYKYEEEIKKLKTSSSEFMILFGSPKKSVMDILKSDITVLKNLPNTYIVNMFPNQGTSTVRLEEAIFGTLSILRYIYR